MAGTDYEVLKDGFVINGKQVVVIFLFKQYWQKYLQSDYKELIKYHKKKLKLENPQSELDLKFYHAIDRFPKITYEYFKEAVRRFMLRVTHQVLKDDPSFVTAIGDVFEIQIKVVRVPNKEWYGANIEDISDSDHAYLEYNGLWLLNTVVLPWLVFQRVDYKILYKFMQHELGHCRDWVKRLYRLEDYAKKRISPIMRRMHNFSLFYLYLTFENLRVEGVHEFADKRDMQRIDVNMDLVRKFRVLVEELITKKKLKDAEEFFENNLGSMSHQGIYYVGRLSAQTIAFAVAKREGFANQVYLVLPNGQKADLSQLNAAMSTLERFYISQLPAPVFNKAFSIMSPLRYREFIQMYEWACNELGISNENRVVTWAWFDDIKKRATNWYETNRLKEVQAKEYVPTEYAERV